MKEADSGRDVLSGLPEEIAFRWLEEDVDGTWFLLGRDREVPGWCVAVWS